MNFLKPAFALTFIILCSLFAKAQEITLVGNYEEHITSMCSQGCETYQLGVFRMTKKIDLKGEKQEAKGGGQVSFKMSTFGGSISGVATGKLVTVKELPTVAGPRADNSQIGIYAEVERFELKDFTPVEVMKFSISDSNLKLLEAGKDYTVNISVTNPIAKDLELKISIAYGEYLSFKLDKSGKTQVSYKIKNDGYTSRPKLLILKEGIDENQVFKSSYENAVKTGLMFYYSEYISLKGSH